MSWVLMLFACGGSETDPVQPSGPPDIVMVVVDTLRADPTSMYGYARDTTPRITEFAEDAVRFERAYAASPWTKPSITTLLTSTLPRDHGVVQWEHVQDEDLVSMSTHLKSQGYATQAYVSHHALAPKHNRFHLGFDVYDTSVFGGDRGSAHKISSAREVTARLALFTCTTSRQAPPERRLHS